MIRIFAVNLQSLIGLASVCMRLARRLAAIVLFLVSALACHRIESVARAEDFDNMTARTNFTGMRAGEEHDVAGIKLCWCPAGKFTMGSPPDEPERRPGEDQVDVTLSKGFWMSKYETTQGQW